MKKLLIGTAAVALGLSLAAPAKAEGVKLDVAGHFKGYAVWNDQDTTAGTDVRELDILRETEIHFTGETTLDNGLTVGAHVETDLDQSSTDSSGDTSQGIDTDEAYAYFSGAWGRVNFGEEDGAAYLLQVAAPSADSNVDGIRSYVNPVAMDQLGVGFATGGVEVDYDQEISAKESKVTYITPVFSGFQAGLSYTPEVDSTVQDTNGPSLDNQDDNYGDVIDVALRYEGMFEEVGFAFGFGYTAADLEANGGTATDDRKAWNAGLDLDFGPIGAGIVYKEDDREDLGAAANDEEIWVLGVDYTTGPYKLGASYFNADNFNGVADDEVERYAAGVTYTYGPGMTFRGSLNFLEAEDGSTTADADATTLLLGTQINF